MAEFHHTDEAALWAGIRAAPADDAPWLVYADWLDEHGRDREAATIRRFLPNVQMLLLLGAGLPAVMDMVARQEPTAPDWGGPPFLHPPPAPPPDRPVAAEEAVPTGSGASPLFWILPGALIGLMSCLGGVRHQARLDRPTNVFVDRPEPHQEIAFAHAEAGRRTVPVGLRLRQTGWHESEAAGYTFRRVGGQGLIVFALPKDGPAVVLRWEPVGFGFPTLTVGRWLVTTTGAIGIVGPNRQWAYWVRKMGAESFRYTVEVNGREDVLIRSRIDPEGAAKPGLGADIAGDWRPVP